MLSRFNTTTRCLPALSVVSLRLAFAAASYRIVILPPAFCSMALPGEMSCTESVLFSNRGIYSVKAPGCIISAIILFSLNVIDFFPPVPKAYEKINIPAFRSWFPGTGTKSLLFYPNRAFSVSASYNLSPSGFVPQAALSVSVCDCKKEPASGCHKSPIP